jgi:hypothetical protein
MNDNTIKQAVDTLTDAFKTDADFRYAYQANIAMAFVDEFRRHQKESGRKHVNYSDLHTVANTAADNFLTLLAARPEAQ